MYPHVTKPRLRGAVHQAAFYSAIGAGLMLIAEAHTSLAKVAVAVYVLSLVGLFGVSALYHRPQWGEAARKWLRRIDHATIYFLIAGSSTPVILLGLGGFTGARLLWIIWTAAILGVLKCFFWPTAPRLLNVLLYIAVGLISVPYLGELRTALGSYGVYLLVIGGVIYSLGAFVYCFRKPNPFPKTFGYHEIFHAMVVLASGFHFKVIYDLIQVH